MSDKRFRLTARVSSSRPQAIRLVVEKIITKGSIKKEDGEFVIETEMQGSSAKELNRFILSALRKAEKKTRLRAEWTSDDGTTLRFFDYVLKKARKNLKNPK
jgi:hypothetical protein